MLSYLLGCCCSVRTEEKKDKEDMDFVALTKKQTNKDKNRFMVNVDRKLKKYNSAKMLTN